MNIGQKVHPPSFTRWRDLRAVLPATSECEGGCRRGVSTWLHLVGGEDEDVLVVSIFERLNRGLAGAVAGIYQDSLHDYRALKSVARTTRLINNCDKGHFLGYASQYFARKRSTQDEAQRRGHATKEMKGASRNGGEGEDATQRGRVGGERKCAAKCSPTQQKGTRR